MYTKIFKVAQGRNYQEDICQATFEVMERNTTRQFKNKVLEQFLTVARSTNDFQLFYWTTVNDVDMLREFFDDDEILIGNLKAQPWKKDFFFHFFFKKIYNPDEEVTLYCYHDNDETVRSLQVHPRQSGQTLFRQMADLYLDTKFKRITISCSFFSKFKDACIKNNTEPLYKYPFFQPDIVLRLQAGESSKGFYQSLPSDPSMDDKPAEDPEPECCECCLKKACQIL